MLRCWPFSFFYYKTAVKTGHEIDAVYSIYSWSSEDDEIEQTEKFLTEIWFFLILLEIKGSKILSGFALFR